MKKKHKKALCGLKKSNFLQTWVGRSGSVGVRVGDGVGVCVCVRARGVVMGWRQVWVGLD